MLMKLKTILFLITLQISFSSFAQLKIKDGGRVGIGTSDVSWYKTHINAPYGIMALNLKNSTGDWGYISRAQVTSAHTKAWVVTWNGTDRVFATGEGAVYLRNAVISSSDSSLKMNINRIDHPLNKIGELRGVYYNFKPEVEHDSAIGGTVVVSDERRYIGLIAQEVEEIVPEVVRTDNNGLKGIAYANLVALLIEGMKEQQAEIVALQESVSNCCNVSLGSLNGEVQKKASTVSYGKNDEKEQNKNILFQNVPNPFNQSTTINYEIITPFKRATLYVYNYQGEQLKSYSISSTGSGSVAINASEFKPGIYLYDLIIDNTPVGTKKMILTQ